jgi:hypothetical protein
MRYTLAFPVASAVAAGVCVPGGVSAQNIPPSVSRLVADAKKQIRTIDMAAFKSAFDKNDVGLLVDVREPGEYADGCIPGGRQHSTGRD